MGYFEHRGGFEQHLELPERIAARKSSIRLDAFAPAAPDGYEHPAPGSQGRRQPSEDARDARPRHMEERGGGPNSIEHLCSSKPFEGPQAGIDSALTTTLDHIGGCIERSDAKSPVFENTRIHATSASGIED